VKIEMDCVVCKAQMVCDDLDELELDEDHDIETNCFACEECGKVYFIGG
jgi:uncharacterized protein with PIN domain